MQQTAFNPQEYFVDDPFVVDYDFETIERSARQVLEVYENELFHAHDNPYRHTVEEFHELFYRPLFKYVLERMNALIDEMLEMLEA